MLRWNRTAQADEIARASPLERVARLAHRGTLEESSTMQHVFEWLLGLVVGAIALVWVLAEIIADWWRGKR